MRQITRTSILTIVLALTVSAPSAWAQTSNRHSGSVASNSSVTAVSSAAAAPEGGARFAWPTRTRPLVRRGFDTLDHNWLPGHRGVDLEAGAGSTIYASAEGTVAFAGEVDGVPSIAVEHNGIRTTYQPVVPRVVVGDRVGRGDPIGTLDPGHCETPCLHWGAKTGPSSYVNPLALIADGVRLLE